MCSLYVFLRAARNDSWTKVRRQTSSAKYLREGVERAGCL